MNFIYPAEHNGLNIENITGKALCLRVSQTDNCMRQNNFYDFKGAGTHKKI